MIASATPAPLPADTSLTLAEKVVAMRRKFRGTHNPAAFVDTVRARKPWQLREALTGASVTPGASGESDGASSHLVPYYIISTET